MNRNSSHLKMILIAMLGLLPFAVVGASAQQKAQVTVPFPFIANQVSLPAGHYLVLASDSSLNFINADNGKAEAMVVIRHEQANAMAPRGSMKFSVIGNQRVLTEVQFAGSSDHSELLCHPKRGHLAAGNTQQKNGQFEIAMK